MVELENTIVLFHSGLCMLCYSNTAAGSIDTKIFVQKLHVRGGIYHTQLLCRKTLMLPVEYIENSISKYFEW